MKNFIFLILLSVCLISCDEDNSTPEERKFNIEAAGTKYDFKITIRNTGTSTEGVLENLTGITGAYSYPFVPEIGKTYKVYLSGAGLTSWKITYKGQELMYSVAPGSGLAKDFVITD